MAFIAKIIAIVFAATLLNHVGAVPQPSSITRLEDFVIPTPPGLAPCLGIECMDIDDFLLPTTTTPSPPTATPSCSSGYCFDHTSLDCVGTEFSSCSLMQIPGRFECKRHWTDYWDAICTAVETGWTYDCHADVNPSHPTPPVYSCPQRHAASPCTAEYCFRGTRIPCLAGDEEEDFASCVIEESYTSPNLSCVRFTEGYGVCISPLSKDKDRFLCERAETPPGMPKAVTAVNEYWTCGQAFYSFDNIDLQAEEVCAAK